jgi:hypothetical protein
MYDEHLFLENLFQQFNTWNLITKFKNDVTSAKKTRKSLIGRILFKISRNFFYFTGWVSWPKSDAPSHDPEKSSKVQTVRSTADVAGRPVYNRNEKISLLSQKGETKKLNCCCRLKTTMYMSTALGKIDIHELYFSYRVMYKSDSSLITNYKQVIKHILLIVQRFVFYLLCFVCILSRKCYTYFSICRFRGKSFNITFFLLKKRVP